MIFDMKDGVTDDLWLFEEKVNIGDKRPNRSQGMQYGDQDCAAKINC